MNFRACRGTAAHEQRDRDARGAGELQPAERVLAVAMLGNEWPI